MDGATAPDGRARRASRFLLSAMLSLALATGIAAVAIVPAHRIAAGNARGEQLARATAEVGSLHPLRLLELVAPGSMGDPYADYVAGPWVGERALDDRPVVYGCYLGASVLVLASFAFGRRRRGPLILGLIALFAVLLAMGRHTPVHAMFRTLVPPLAFMRGPEKYLIVSLASSCLLAALGIERLSSGTVWLRSIFCAIPLGALALFLPFVPAAMAGHVRHGALAGACRGFGHGRDRLVVPAASSARGGLGRRHRDGRLGGGGWAVAEFRPQPSSRRIGAGGRCDCQGCARAWPARASAGTPLA